MSELFDTSHIHVLSYDIRDSLDPAKTIFYDFLSGQNTRINLHSRNDVYVHTAFEIIVEGLDRDLTEFYRQMKKLTPVQEVKQMVVNLLAAIEKLGVKEFTSVHIRSNSDLSTDVPTQRSEVDVPIISPNAMPVLIKMRRACNPLSFETAMRKSPVSTTFVISTDSPDVVRRLKTNLRGMYNLLLLEDMHVSGCESRFFRQKPCLQVALAEAILLSQSESFIYSHFSSFSELIRSFHANLDWPIRAGCETVDI
eukprot:CAMPEP_0179702576 /NCGR_PEP_ID=MMETSP0937-20121108/2347_1 /TAXON_ID=548131 ORGANISM="Ostreococcus mediterraneus, Strain clade-D-RCC2593" /NCGR_SAMPLE_ID=MMETSP0937 /ASSEMBLY_ACC=CAM_ASM_000575 /LENGTH=252 /DNA_ID=CAMNT_0021575711 /DNA_START=544 /DNA_END=1302 /DNA_ORIENTATION=-